MSRHGRAGRPFDIHRSKGNVRQNKRTMPFFTRIKQDHLGDFTTGPLRVSLAELIVTKRKLDVL